MNLQTVLAGILNVDPSSISSLNTSAARRSLMADQAALTFSVKTIGSDRAFALANAIAPNGSASVFSQQSFHAAGIPVSGPPVISPPKQAPTGEIVSDQCDIGCYQKQGTTLCLPCEKGTVAPTTPVSACTTSPANMFTINTTTFLACPSGSTSAAGSYKLSQCMCGYGKYPFPDPVLDPSLLAFDCLPCPDGGFCDTQAAWTAAGSDGTPVLFPLATDGYWRHPNSLYELWECEDGFCLEEKYSSCNVLELLSRYSGAEMLSHASACPTSEKPGAAAEPGPAAEPGATAEYGATSAPAERRRLLEETASEGNGTLTHAVTPLDAEEVDTGTANCRVGHRGVVCSECWDGWTVQQGFCAACPPNSSLKSWNPALFTMFSLGGALLFILFMIYFVLGSVLQEEFSYLRRLPYVFKKKLTERLTGRLRKAGAIPEHEKPSLALLLIAVFPFGGVLHKWCGTSPREIRSAASRVEDVGAEPAPSPQSNATAAQLSGVGSRSTDVKKPSGGLSVMVMYAFCRVPMKMAVENFQIISSFKKRIKVAWPSALTSLFSNVAFLNLNIFSLPKTACLSPRTPFFQKLNTLTVGATALFSTVGLLWVVGLLILRRRGHQHKMRSFNAICLSKLLSLMTLLYAPLVGTCPGAPSLEPPSLLPSQRRC